MSRFLDADFLVIVKMHNMCISCGTIAMNRADLFHNQEGSHVGICTRLAELIGFATCSRLLCLD